MSNESLEIPILDLSKDLQAVSESFEDVALIFTYLLHQDNLPEKQQSTFFDAIKRKEFPFVSMTKNFAYHLIGIMNEEEKSRLSILKDTKIKVASLENEALVDFIEIEMVDVTTTYRQWEYGKYAIQYFVNQLDSIDTLVAKSSKLGNDMELLERFTSDIALKDKVMDNHEMLFLVQAFKAKLNIDEPKMASYNLIGNIVQRNLLGMSLRMDLLKSAFQKSLSLTIENHNKKGPRP